MMKRISQIALRLALVPICLLAFQSCEFDNNDDNYVELEKPRDITIGIDLAGVNPGEVIQVPNNTPFYYTLNAEGKEVLQLKYSLDGKEIVTHTQTSVHLSVEKIDSEVHNLKVEMAFRTGTGSLADRHNLEAYLGEHTFKIKFIDVSEADFNITQTVDANNNLKLEWKALQNIDVEKYEVYKNSWDTYKLATITDLSNPSVVDPDYVYGLVQYKVRAILKNSTCDYVEDKIDVQSQILTSDNATTEAVENNKIRVTWTNPNPYPANYVVICGSDKETMQVVTNNSNTVDMPRKLFGPYPCIYDIYILPKFEDPKNFNSYHQFYTYFREDRIAVDYRSEHYNTNNDFLYALHYDKIHILDATKDFALVRSQQLDEGHTASFKVSQLGIVGIHSWESTTNLNVYSNDKLTVRTDKILSITDFGFGGNLLLTYANDANYTGQFTHRTNIYDASNTQQKPQWLFAIDAPIANKHYTSALSVDGKYMYLCTTDGMWIKLYEMVNNQPIERKLWENANIKGPQFNPANSNEMVLIHRNKFEVIDLATRQVKFTQDGQFVCIDPATGNVMFYTDNVNNITILDNTYSKVLANIKLDISLTSSTPNLYNNYILWQGIYADYRNLIEK